MGPVSGIWEARHLGEGAPGEGAVRADGVVVVPELVEQRLELAHGGRSGLAVEPFLQGLVEAFDFPAGLWVVGPGVVEPDPVGCSGCGR